MTINISKIKTTTIISKKEESKLRKLLVCQNQYLETVSTFEYFIFDNDKTYLEILNNKLRLENRKRNRSECNIGAKINIRKRHLGEQHRNLNPVEMKQL